MDAFNKYVGQIFDRRYKIIKIIGVGGMAVVFEAIDMVMKRTVAVKMLREEISNDAQSVKRFINESKAIWMLSHPNIVSIYDVSVKDNLKYIVMELVDGITLKNYMNTKGALPTEELLRYTEQILRALEHAHSKGIIHRDIKPQNIMLLQNGRIKVADFGIAKLPNAETVTMTDKAIGTVFYISPEQASGKKIDPRSDLYSLGVVMYEMATGQLPFNAESPVSVALMQVSKQPRPPREINPNIPLGLEQLILGAMEKNPERRLQSARQMLRPVTQLISNPNAVFRVKQSAPSMSAGSASQHGGTAKQANGAKNSGKYVRGGSQRHKNAKTDHSKGTKKRVQNRSMMPIIMGVTLSFLLVLGVTGYYMLTLLLAGSQLGAGKQITIEQFVGQNYEDINNEDLQRYYNVIVEKEYDKDKAVGEISEQYPEEGTVTKITLGEKIDLTLRVNYGEKVITMADYSMKDYRAAKIELNELSMSLNVTTEGESSDTIPYGYVTRTDPEFGTLVSAGSKVTVYYSTGAQYEKIAMPDFKGKTVDVAYAMLLEAGIDYGKLAYAHSATVPENCIISQSIIAGNEVVKGVTKVNFTISLGPEHPVTEADDED